MEEQETSQPALDQNKHPKEDRWYSSLTRVTPLSKYLAMVLFVALPFLGYWVGYVSAPTDTCYHDIARTTSTYLSASPAHGNAPLTVRFQSTYAYPETYVGGKMLTLDFGDGRNTILDESVEHSYTSPGMYEARLLGCKESVDLVCEQVELDVLTIEVVDHTPVPNSPFESETFVEKDDNPKSINHSCVPRSDEVNIYTDSVGTVESSVAFQNPRRANITAVPIMVGEDNFVSAEIYSGSGVDLGKRYIHYSEWRCATDEHGYRFEPIDTGVKFLDAASNEVVQTIFLKDIPINNPKISFVEVYGSESAMERERQDRKPVLTNFDVNFDGYNDLGILVDTGPKESGYVFYIYDQTTERLIPAKLESEQSEIFVVYAPTVNTNQKVLQGRFSVSNPRRIDYFTYRYDSSRGVFIETQVVGDGARMLESTEGTSNTISIPNDPAVPDTETGLNTSPISVERCEGQDLNLCFGSGRQRLTSTEHTTVWSLVSKDGTLVYGVIEKDTGGMWTILIQ